MGGRIVLLVTSPRLPAGLLTAQAWDLVREHPVYTAAEGDQARALRAAGVEVTFAEPAVGVLLEGLAATGTVVWLSAPSGDQDLARELGLRLVREPGLAELELLYGSWDPPGARLLDAVAVVDRLAAPEGDPWLRQFLPPGGSPSRLAQYLLEEAYEAYDAVRGEDPAAVREELGDLMFQVTLHAALAGLGEQFDIDDVAGDLVDKLIRRNPHVFGDAVVADVGEITENWEQIKQAEKSRTSSMDGIPLSQPALALAAKVLSRAERAGIDLPAAAPVAGKQLAEQHGTEKELGAVLFQLVRQATAAGLDAEGALRRAVQEFSEAVRAAELRRGTG